MERKAFSDTVLLSDLRDVLRVHLYFKLIEKGIRPFENDIDIILELYLFGGYANSHEQNEFINVCISKHFKKSKQSVRNTLSKYVGLGIFKKQRNASLVVSEDFIPNVKFDQLVLLHAISHNAS
jgi:hypothetical protein